MSDALFQALKNVEMGAAGYKSFPTAQSSHAGAATYEASCRMGLLAAENILNIFEKEKCTIQRTNNRLKFT